ncbi:hypothetical protein [uncultured Megasphaera sp.]|uniref:hypothetical protein n=1 Tax=uncultured Megasphaera sp. TaxID=165188 RepID=UPI00266EE30C|nr:hypothetical protein [uncultured Megasphaera sp.]
MDDIKYYKCTKEFSVNLVDQYGYETTESRTIHVGSVWYWDTENTNPVGTEITLVEVENEDWIGIDKDDLNMFFTNYIPVT